jgi:hypothetical protein
MTLHLNNEDIAVIGNPMHFMPLQAMSDVQLFLPVDAVLQSAGPNR